MQIVYILIIAILSIMNLIILYYFVWHTIGLIRTKGVPYVQSFDDDLEVLKQIEEPVHGKLLDLGCGDGKAIRFLMKNFKIENADGYDINQFAILKGKLVNKIKKITNINLIHKKFQEANLGDYDTIYIYLFPHIMELIEDRVFENIKNDCIIISNSFKFAKHQPLKVYQNNKGKDKIYLYRR